MGATTHPLLRMIEVSIGRISDVAGDIEEHADACGREDHLPRATEALDAAAGALRSAVIALTVARERLERAGIR